MLKNCSNKVIVARAKLLKKIREYFYNENVLEVETPLLCKTTTIDPHIDSVSFCPSIDNKLYLQTSPEFAMKRLLANGIGSIYQICKAFRDKEQSNLHNLEFTILEWYRVGFDDKLLMNDVDKFLQYTINAKPAIHISYKNLFLEHLQINPHKANVNNLKDIALRLPLHLSSTIVSTYDADDWLNLLFSEIIQPKLNNENPWIVYNYPNNQAMLSKKVEYDGEIIAKRFEVFYKGVELANGYDELQCPKEQLSRFIEDNNKRKLLNKEEIPIDDELINALKSGLPDCSGIAFGLDRLLLLYLGLEKIQDVICL